MPSFSKPRPIPVLCTVLAFALLAALGTWQLHRLHWKEALLADIHAKMQQEPLQLPISGYDATTLAFRKVKAEGVLQYDKEIFLYHQRNKESGYFLITPLVMQDGSAILVNRGWIPMDMRQSYVDGKKSVGEMVSVEGVLQPGETQGMFVPDNNISKNVWFWLDLDDAKRLSGFDYPSLFIRETGVKKPGEYPIKNDATIDIRNDHLQYAITWYILAAAVIVIFILYHRKDKPRYPVKL